MRLKYIKIAGFKSFVDVSKINFVGNLCSIVGPNGCGKSNIIDAVRWVMGENSSKSLRGESVADVVFNGSSTRQPVGQASVELVFDNHDHTLKGEFANYNEVSIKRKTTRDGQSTYFLNNQKCRRRDVTDLFLGTGLRSRSYSIIEQGMISRLIESRPEELRVYIEEAAGISRYKERRKETANRINRTKANLERVDDLCQELDKQLAHLKRQAKAAETYQQLKQQERQKKSDLAAIQWRDLNLELGHKMDTIKHTQHKMELLQSEKHASVARLDLKKDEASQLQQVFNECNSHFLQCSAEIARLEQAIEYQRQQETQWQKDHASIEAQLQHQHTIKAKDMQEIEHLQQQQQAQQPQLEKLQADLAHADEQLIQSEAKLSAWQSVWQTQTTKEANFQKQSSVNRTRLQYLQDRHQQLQQEIQQLAEEQQSLAQQSHTQAITQAESEVNQAQATWHALQDDYKTQHQQLKHLQESERNTQAQLDEQQHSISQLNGQVTSLQLLLQEAQQSRPSCPLEWQAKDIPDLLHSAQVEAGWENALEQVLGDWLQTPFVHAQGLADIFATPDTLDNYPQLSMLYELSQDTQIISTQTKADVVYTSLLTKVKIKQVEAARLCKVLLSHVYIADSLPQARQILSQLPVYASVILASGLWLGHGWLRTAKVAAHDDTNSASHGKGLLERKKQLDSQQSVLDDTQVAYHLLLQTRTAQKDQHATLQAQLADTRSQQDKAQQIWQQHKNTVALLQQKHQQSVDQAKALTLRLHARQQEQIELDHSLQTFQAQEDVVQEQLSDIQASLSGTQAEQQPLQEALAQHRQVRNNLQDASVKLESTLKSLATQQQALQKSLLRTDEQIQQWSLRKADLMQRHQEMDKEPTQNPEHLTEQLQHKIAARFKHERELTRLRDKMTEFTDAIKTAEQQGLQQDQAISLHQEQLQEHKLQERELHVTANNIKQQWQAENINITHLADQLEDDVSSQTLQASLDKVQVAIQKLGAINLVAIEEYQEHSKRKTFLDQQRADLNTALSSLEEAIGKIDKETRGRFKDTFMAVNNNLGGLFPKVFGGGKASLELVDDDLLTTGISLMAQPPGKRNSSIHVLSGGEKALTAIALIFSIFKLNPAPFCMLDEVDAPLDDANVNRYARLVKEMSSQVQFIYISHNKIAMEMANQLVGVTMQESGVSRLVTVDVDEAVRLAE